MLSKREYGEWALQEHKDRDYQSEEEKRFFNAIENPKPASPELKKLVKNYGRYAADKS